MREEVWMLSSEPHGLCSVHEASVLNASSFGCRATDHTMLTMAAPISYATKANTVFGFLLESLAGLDIWLLERDIKS